MAYKWWLLTTYLDLVWRLLSNWLQLPGKQEALQLLWDFWPSQTGKYWKIWFAFEISSRYYSKNEFLNITILQHIFGRFLCDEIPCLLGSKGRKFVSEVPRFTWQGNTKLYGFYVAIAWQISEKPTLPNNQGNPSYPPQSYPPVIRG